MKEEEEEASTTWVITCSVVRACAVCMVLLLLLALVIGGCNRLAQGVETISPITGSISLFLLLALSVFFVRRAKGDAFLRMIEDEIEEFSLLGFLSFRKRNSESAKQDLERMLDAGLLQLISDHLKKQTESPPKDETARKQNEDELKKRFLENWVRQDNLRNRALQIYLEQTGARHVSLRVFRKTGFVSFDAVVRQNMVRRYVRVIVSESGDLPENRIAEAVSDFQKICKGSAMIHSALDIVIAIPRTGNEEYRVLTRSGESLIRIHVCPVELQSEET